MPGFMTQKEKQQEIVYMFKRLAAQGVDETEAVFRLEFGDAVYFQTDNVMNLAIQAVMFGLISPEEGAVLFKACRKILKELN